MRIHWVDVFAETPLSGNPLAVIEGARGLDGTRMQAIARELNTSETTFVTEERGDSARVRIFTPAEELPFAGHPVLGTAWVLARGRPRLQLQLTRSTVTVALDGDRVWAEAPTVALGSGYPAPLAAALLGLTPDALDPEHPPRLASIGPRFLMTGLRSLDDLARLQPDTVLQDQRLALGEPVPMLLAYVRQGHHAGANTALRMFFRAPDLREDPATGSAALCLAADLAERCGTPLHLILDQGVEMGRPSRLEVMAAEGRLALGGRIRPVFSGQLDPGLYGGLPAA